DNIVLLDENCPTNNLPESFFSENSLVINRSNCDFDAAFKSIGVIRHFNELPAYSLLIKNDEMER
ncbi:hypothetical protein KC686_04210, partial [Candidatus Woesebacteria bacterium]|nr:hypothetical protein [Candidatus Woesebacteria bacterium]